MELDVLRTEKPFDLEVDESMLPVTSGSQVIEDAKRMSYTTEELKAIKYEDAEIDSYEILEDGSQVKYLVRFKVPNDRNDIVKFERELNALYQYRTNKWILTNVDTKYLVPDDYIIGSWSGTYKTGSVDGLVKVIATEYDKETNYFNGILEFEILGEFSRVGSYEFIGSLNDVTLDVSIKAGEWIDKPENVRTIDFNGKLNPTNNTIKNESSWGTKFNIEKEFK